MNGFRVFLWFAAGASFLVGMVSMLFIILLPAAALFAVAAVALGRNRERINWLATFTSGAGVSSLALYLINPGTAFFLWAGLAFFAVAAASILLDGLLPSRP